MKCIFMNTHVFAKTTSKIVVVIITTSTGFLRNLVEWSLGEHRSLKGTENVLFLKEQDGYICASSSNL